MSQAPFTVDSSSPHILLFSSGSDASAIQSILQDDLEFDSVQNVQQSSSAISEIKDNEYDILLLDLDATEKEDRDKSNLVKIFTETTRSFVSVLVLSHDTHYETVSFAFKHGALDFLSKEALPQEDFKESLKEKVINCMDERSNLVETDSKNAHHVDHTSIIENLKTLFRKTRNQHDTDSNPNKDSIVTPIELVVDMISSLLEGNYSSHQQRIILGGILKSLVGSSNVYHPQLKELSNPSPWFTADYLNAIKSNNTQNASFSLLSQDDASSDNSPTKESVNEYVFPPKEVEDTKIENLESFEFDMFQFKMDQLTKAIVQMFEAFDLIKHFNIDKGKLISFIFEVRSRYLPNLYHNYEHAWDVLQFSYACLHDPSIQKVLDSPLDRLCTLVASLAHDIGHEGVNNSFQKRTRSNLAMIYNDEHCLEHYHASTLFNLILKSRNNIIEHLSEDDYFTFREFVIHSILCTDPERHCELLAKFNSNINAGPLEPTKENKKQVIAMVVKSADISNVARPFHLAQKWAERVIQEFLSQGDKELSLGLTVNSLNDRKQANKSALQMGFIKFFATPLFESMTNAFPTFKPIKERVLDNHRRWSEIHEREDETGIRPRYDIVDSQKDQKKERKDFLVIARDMDSAEMIPQNVVAGISILCVSPHSDTIDISRELLLGYEQFSSENSPEKATKVLAEKDFTLVILEASDSNTGVQEMLSVTCKKNIPVFMVSDTNNQPSGATQFAVKPIYVPDFFQKVNTCIQTSLENHAQDDFKCSFSKDKELLDSVLCTCGSYIRKLSQAESKQQWERLRSLSHEMQSVISEAGLRSLAFSAYDLAQICSQDTAQNSRHAQIAAKFLTLKEDLNQMKSWYKAMQQL